MLPSLALACAAHAGLIILISSSKAMMAAPAANPAIVSVPMIVVSMPAADAPPFATPAVVPLPTLATQTAPPEAGQTAATPAAAAPPPPAPSVPVPTRATAASEASISSALPARHTVASREPATHAFPRPFRAQAVPQPRAASLSAPAGGPQPSPAETPTGGTTRVAAMRQPAVAAAAEASFEGRLLQAVQAEARRSYPAAARMMGIAGQAAVRFEYRDGAVRVIGLSQSSGAPVLDRAALAAVQDAQYPPAPPELAGRTLVKLVHVKFELNPG